MVCRENRIAGLIPQELLGVREAIHAALNRMAEHSVETNWSMAGPIPGDPDWAGGTVFRDVREITVQAPAWAVFRAVCRVGGGNGWYAADILWKIRGWMDQLSGGPGLRRGRRDSETVGYGEALDFWRVVGFERDRRLALRAEMKLPGEALLEFRIEALNDGQCVLRSRHYSGREACSAWPTGTACCPSTPSCSVACEGIEREALKIAPQRSGHGLRDFFISGTGFSARRADASLFIWAQVKNPGAEDIEVRE